MSRGSNGTGLFDRDVKTIGKHIATALQEELKDLPTVANFATVQQEGARWVKRQKEYLFRGYAINPRMEQLEKRVADAEEKIDFFVKTSLPPVEGIFFDGQIYDAYEFVCDLIRSAKTRIILIDNSVYLVGASLKDLGKKWFGITQMQAVDPDAMIIRLQMR